MKINREIPSNTLWQAKRKHSSGHVLKEQNFTCWYPHRSLTVDSDGFCFICICEAWLPYSVGNILEFQALEDVWTCPTALKLQQNTQSGSTFKFCDLKTCTPWAQPTALNLPFQITIGTDDSCNLWCPSCRTGMIHFNKGPVFEKRKLITDHLMNLLLKFDHPCSILLGGTGEVFSSKILSELMYEYVPRKNHLFKIRTNGTLLDGRVKDSAIMSQLLEFVISIDAGSEEVYSVVRPPGKWSKLMHNLEFLVESNYIFTFNFVLQRENLYDVINYVDLCQRFNSIGFIEGVNDWMTWDDFNEHRVHQTGDKLYSEWCDVKQQLLSHEWRDCLVFGANIDPEEQFTFDRVYLTRPEFQHRTFILNNPA